MNKYSIMWIYLLLFLSISIEKILGNTTKFTFERYEKLGMFLLIKENSFTLDQMDYLTKALNRKQYMFET